MAETMKAGLWTYIGRERQALTDSNGKIIGRVTRLFGSEYLAEADGRRLGCYVAEADAKAAVERACGVRPPLSVLPSSSEGK